MKMKQKELKTGGKILAGCMAALLCESFFGFSFMFTKKATGMTNPFYLLSWRFLTGAIFLLLCVLTGLVKTRLRELKAYKLILPGLLFPGAYYFFETYGIMRTTASESGIVIASVPIATIFLSALILKEKPFRMQVLGIAVSIAGILCCIAAKGISLQFDPAGYACLFCGVLCFSGYAVISRKFSAFSNFEKTFVIIMVGAAVYTGTALTHALVRGEFMQYASLPFRNPEFLMAAAYLGVICSGLSLFLCNFSISKIGATGFASFIGIETVVSILAGVLILGEGFSFLQGIGAILVIGGVYTANARRDSRTQTQEKTK